ASGSGLRDTLVGGVIPSDLNTTALASPPAGPAALRLAHALLAFLSSSPTTNSNTLPNNSHPHHPPFPQTTRPTSLLSSYTYLTPLTPHHPHLNRAILDILEGQLIAGVVIVAFILLFLIREWVVQQQPLLLAGQAVEVEGAPRGGRREGVLWEGVGVEGVEEGEVREGEAGLEGGLEELEQVMRRVEAEGARVRRQADILEQARRRLVELRGAGDERPDLDSEGEAEQDRGELGGGGDISSTPGSGSSSGVPDRKFVGRAAQIQRLLEEAEGILGAESAAGPKGAGRDGEEVADLEGSGNVGRATTPEQSGGGVDNSEELPITNAGPDAKINIRRSGRARARAVPEPRERAGAAGEQRRRREDEAMRRLEAEIRGEETLEALAAALGAQADEVLAAARMPDDALAPEAREATDLITGEPAPDGATPPVRHALDARVDQAGLQDPELDDDEVEEGEEAEDPSLVRPAAPPTYLQRLADWFWGDIVANHAHD
ncbi:hypothetical protein LTR53_017970, partial [Teratosphaeriaceae sp. CCFEE 6253]